MELLGWYGFTKSSPGEPLALQQFCPKFGLKKSHLVPTEIGHSQLSIPQSLSFISVQTMKPANNTNSSPRSSPFLDNEANSSDSEGAKLSEEFGESNNNFGSLSNLDDQSSDSSLDSSTVKSGHFWNLLPKTPPDLPEAPAVVLCFWCKRLCERKNSPEAESMSGGVPLTNGDRQFCSELCFNQCRRASFKKSKICDWCRHVRPTVAYVDFTDGNHQLQFCGDKCLNQYKMQIFCRETEAHLQLHPHLNDLSVTKEATLITPDLWLKSCDESGQKNSENWQSSHRGTDSDHSDEEMAKETITNDAVEKAGVSSCSSLGDISPVSFFEDSEPVNLSTNEAKRSPLRLKGCKGTEESQVRSNSRYGRISRNMNDQGHPVRTKTPKGYSSGDKGQPMGDFYECKPKGTIRVRQLEEQPRLRELEPSVSRVSVSPSTTSSFPGLPGFGGLLMGTRPPLLSSIPNLLPPPPPPHSDVTRPQILPQLLLSHPDLLRCQGLRPPFMLFQPQMQTPQPAPPIPPPLPTQPLPTPKNSAPNPPNLFGGFPPVTVILPLPLPIPIPIPIPLPIPISIKDFLAHNDRTDGDSASGRSSVLQQEYGKNESKEQASSSDLKPCVEKSPPPPHPSKNIIPKSLPKLRKANELSRENIVETSSQDSSKHSRKERRSILRYTSDVYEINGVFVPRSTSTAWDPSLVSSKDKKREEEDVTPTADCEPPSSLAKPRESRSVAPNSEENHRTGKQPYKRQSDTDHNQPLPKKKHLLN